MKLDRLGSFHQTRLSFSRQLIDELINNNWKTNIIEWNINRDGIGNAVIKKYSQNKKFTLLSFFVIKLMMMKGATGLLLKNGI